MPSTTTLIGFALVSAAVMVVPGPSNVFLLAHGIGNGRRSALAAMGGIEAASAVRVLVAAAGVSALLASLPIALAVIRWGGAAYLLLLGVAALRTRPSEMASAQRLSLRRSASKGLVVGLGNPKMVVFYVAFLPQFVHAGHGPEGLQLLVLGAVFWLIGAVWDLGFACASGSIGSWLRRHPRAKNAQPVVEGATYASLAAWAALAG